MLHQYKLNGYNIVLDTCSGSVHAVDEVAYDAIALFESKSEEEIVSFLKETHGVSEEDAKMCLSDIKALKAQGKLFTEDTYAPLADKFKERSGDVVKALCLHVAHTCNLNCS